MLLPATLGCDKPVPDAVGRYDALVVALNGYRDKPSMLLRFDAEAQGIRNDIERRHLQLASCAVFNRKLAAHIGKYDGIFARLCVLWHVIEHAEATRPPVLIAGATARRVADFMHRFLLPHAVAFFSGILGLSDDHDRLTAIAGYILANKLEVVTNRDVQRGSRTMRNLDGAEVRSVFEQLSALGWIEEAPQLRARAPTRWNVNPLCHQLFAERAEEERRRRPSSREGLADGFAAATEG